MDFKLDNNRTKLSYRNLIRQLFFLDFIKTDLKLNNFFFYKTRRSLLYKFWDTFSKTHQIFSAKEENEFKINHHLNFKFFFNLENFWKINFQKTIFLKFKKHSV